MIRREQAERTREQLLDAAAAEFCIHGLVGTRIQDVLDRTGLTRGGIYHHFADKHDMARALASADAERWSEVLGGIGSTGVRGLAALRVFVSTVVVRLDQDPRARAVLRIGPELGDSAAITDSFEAWNDFVIRALQQAIADDEVSDEIEIRGLAATIVDSVYGVCVSPAVGGRPGSASDRADQLGALLEAGARSTAR